MIPQSSPSGHSSALDRFLSGINESVFQIKLGVANIELVNYLNQLLIRFVRVDTMKDFASGAGTPAAQIYELLTKVETCRAQDRRGLYQAIGDYTLFWSGMYPESLLKSRGAYSTNGLVEYSEHGKRCYAIASQMDTINPQPSKNLLSCLSQQYNLCAFGLREVRREWETLSKDQASGLIA